MTEPAVGASTWASGSQVWNGHIGTLMAKARAKAPKSHIWSEGSMFALVRTARSKVLTPAALYRSEEHTSELQSLRHLVCRLLLEKKKISKNKVQPQRNCTKWHRREDRPGAINGSYKYDQST